MPMPKKAEHVLLGIHEGVFGNYTSARTLVRKAVEKRMLLDNNATRCKRIGKKMPKLLGVFLFACKYDRVDSYC